MANKLQQHFTVIRDREEVIRDICTQEKLLAIFEEWSEEQQELFLDYCTGVRGVKMLYDQYFKITMNPETSPERLEDILSLILQEKVQILQILPNESTRIAAEKSLLVLDIVVQLENGSIANVEVQKIGYAFPGQRSACYSADLLMRQYKRVKAKKKKQFRYSDIKKVYTIIFFETSTGDFHDFQDISLLRSKQIVDTGLQIELLQEYIFIALDIFKKKLHNRGIDKENRLEAWLTFLSEDDPEWILNLIETYPEFKDLYQEVYDVCRNTEDIMGLFSEELLELDKNTVEYMIDEMQNEINETNQQLEEQKHQLRIQKLQLEEKDALIAKLQSQLANK